MDVDCFCVAGTALGAPQSHFAWQVQHSEQLQRGSRKAGPQSHFALQVQHLEDLSLFLRGRCIIRTQPMGPKKLTIHGPTFGALVMSQPSYPFCLIPPDTPFVFPRCGLFFVLFR